MPIREMRTNLINSAAKLIETLKTKTTENDDEKKIVHLLKHLPELFITKSDKKEKYKAIIEVELRVISNECKCFDIRFRI